MFRKTEEGRMGILTIPQGTRMYARPDGRTFERARKEFDILAMLTRAPGGALAYSIKLREKFYYVLKEDIPNDES